MPRRKVVGTGDFKLPSPLSELHYLKLKLCSKQYNIFFYFAPDKITRCLSILMLPDFLKIIAT
jgi:hypothetical protein